MALSRGGHQGYGAVREYRDDPNLQDFRDDNGRSFDEEFSQITRNISSINNGANVIEKAAKAIGTDRDNGQAGDKIYQKLLEKARNFCEERRAINHHVSQDTAKTVTATTRLLKQLSKRRLDRSQKLQIDKVTHDFQESLQRFQSLQKKATEKVRDASRKEAQKPKKSAWLDDEDDEPLIEDDSRRQQLMAQEQVIDDDLALIREREEQIRALEGDILDVNEIFRDLGAMVHDQGEQIDTIEANVEKAYTDVEQGTGQLSKAATYQKKARKKMCCLVLIFVIIAAIIAIIIAVSVKK